jgi:hypothetical protein
VELFGDTPEEARDTTVENRCSCSLFNFGIMVNFTIKEVSLVYFGFTMFG